MDSGGLLTYLGAFIKFELIHVSPIVRESIVYDLPLRCCGYCVGTQYWGI